MALLAFFDMVRLCHTVSLGGCFLTKLFLHFACRLLLYIIQFVGLFCQARDSSFGQSPKTIGKESGKNFYLNFKWAFKFNDKMKFVVSNKKYGIAIWILNRPNINRTIKDIFLYQKQQFLETISTNNRFCYWLQRTIRTKLL
jgi:hypothetical protein